MAFTFEPLEIPEVVSIRTDRHLDRRGFFSELYHAGDFRAAGIGAPFVQDNLTRSAKGVMRGLHYQVPPAAQGKLVSVLKGRVFDVAVDLRVGATTYGKWVGRTLDSDTGELLWIPAGFAHGYLVLSESADVFYKVTAEFDADRNRGIRWDDPTLAVDWPIDDPVLSDKDRAQPGFEEADNPFVLEESP